MDSADIRLKAMAFIFASRRVRISSLQRFLLIGYNAVVDIIAALEVNGLIESMDKHGERVINWHHPEWLEIARQPYLWHHHMLAMLAGEYLMEEHGGQWMLIRNIYGQRRVIATFATEEEALGCSIAL